MHKNPQRRDPTLNEVVREYLIRQRAKYKSRRSMARGINVEARRLCRLMRKHGVEAKG